MTKDEAMYVILGAFDDADCDFMEPEAQELAEALKLFGVDFDALVDEDKLSAFAAALEYFGYDAAIGVDAFAAVVKKALDTVNGGKYIHYPDANIEGVNGKFTLHGYFALDY